MAKTLTAGRENSGRFCCNIEDTRVSIDGNVAETLCVRANMKLPAEALQ